MPSFNDPGIEVVLAFGVDVHLRKVIFETVVVVVNEPVTLRMLAGEGCRILVSLFMGVAVVAVAAPPRRRFLSSLAVALSGVIMPREEDRKDGGEGMSSREEYSARLERSRSGVPSGRLVMP
mgnify:CR=1 FL=1